MSAPTTNALHLVVSTDASGVHVMRQDGQPMGEEVAKVVLTKLTPYLLAIPEFTYRKDAPS